MNGINLFFISKYSESIYLQVFNLNAAALLKKELKFSWKKNV